MAEIKGVKRYTMEGLQKNGSLGDWCLDEEDMRIYIRIPDGSERGSVTPWEIYQGEKKQTPSWLWDGNRTEPTLTPSLHWVGVWHGWMRAGKLVEA